MAIEDLLAILQPPAKPVEVRGNDNRKQVEQTLGLALPDDFWEYGERFGSGKIVYSDVKSAIDLMIYNPYSSAYQAGVTADCDTLRTLKQSSSGDQIPYDVFPDKPGLLSWGNDVNGNTYYWLTEGSRNSWPLIIFDVNAYDNAFERFDMSMTSFLSKILDRAILPAMWQGADFFSVRSGISFRPGY